jgi:hypothetical protein
MSKQIKTKKETIQYLSDINHLRGFIIELQQYVKERIYLYQDHNGDLQFSYRYDHNDGDIPDDTDVEVDDWMKCFIRFCNNKRLNWAAAYRMFSGYMDGYPHNSELIVNHEIDDKFDAAHK